MNGTEEPSILNKLCMYSDIQSVVRLMSIVKSIELFDKFEIIQAIDKVNADVPALKTTCRRINDALKLRKRTSSSDSDNYFGLAIGNSVRSCSSNF